MGERDRPRSVHILLVEDNPGDARLVEEAFTDARLANRLTVVHRGDEALDVLRRRGDHADAARVDIVLLDVHLPDVDAADLVAEIRGTPALADLTVFLLSGTAVARSTVDASGADSFLTKPIDVEEFLAHTRDEAGYWVELVGSPEDR